MSFRARLVLVAAAAVAAAVAAASAVVYVVVRDELRDGVDEALVERAEEVSRVPLRAVQGPTGEFFLHIRGAPLGGDPGYVQVAQAEGPPIRPPVGAVQLPVGDRARAVARGDAESFFADATVDGVRVRVLTFPYAAGYALQVARPLTEVDRALGQIRTFLVLIAFAGIAAAAALGLVVSRAALAPLRRLTHATERVTETGDLSERIAAGGQDELSRLAGSFNTMLAALEGSVRAQRQLVADASHELRTPLTSLRTNFEVLQSGRRLPPGERRRLLDDVGEQLGEMTTLVAELIELARGDGHPAEPEDVRLDLLAAGAVERARRDRPGVTFSTDFEESLVHGVPSSLERAIANILDNAAKWSPPDGEVDVRVRAAELTVRDRGPGIDDADLPFVFDRFYRSPSARTLPGFGLGLAIVRQVAEAHGGTVAVERAEGGGTLVILRLDGRV